MNETTIEKKRKRRRGIKENNMHKHIILIELVFIYLLRFSLIIIKKKEDY